MLKVTDLEDLVHEPGESRGLKLLYILAVDVEKPKPVKEIKQIGRRAGLTTINSWNVSAALKRQKELAICLPEGWKLSHAGRTIVAEFTGVNLPGARAKVVASDLRQHLAKIKDANTRSFMEEAVACFENHHFRAAVVLSWVGAMSLLHDHVINHCLEDFNAEAQKRFKDWRPARTTDDLGRMKEHHFLDVIEAISVIGKTVKTELQGLCLGLRNGCGHPSSLKIAENRVAAHIEMLILNVYSKFA